jgi:hypothetical protein
MQQLERERKGERVCVRREKKGKGVTASLKKRKLNSSA